MAGGVAEADLPQPHLHEAEDDELLQHGVLRGREHQHRHPPPLPRQRLGDDRQVGAEGVGREVEDHAHRADTEPRAGRRAPSHRGCSSRRPAPTRPEPGPGADQQVRRQRDRHEREGDAQQLVGQVEPRPVRGERVVEVGRLRRQRPRGGERRDDADDRVDRAPAQGDEQHDRELGPQQRLRQVRHATRDGCVPESPPRSRRLGRGAHAPSIPQPAEVALRTSSTNAPRCTTIDG